MDFEFTREQEDIARAAREFAQKEFSERAEEFDRDETFDSAIHKKAAELGLVGVYISEKYGGAGLGIVEQCILHEEFSAVDFGCGGAIISSCFGSEIIHEFGSEEQKSRYLPLLTGGDAIMGCALTEPDAGSDLAAARTLAVRDGEEFVINGSKMFITNGTIADFVLCFAVTDPKNSDIHSRHSMIIVERNREGFEANKLRGKLGFRASDTGELSFNNVRVPCSNIVGREGKGFAEAMYLFNLNRIGMAAQAVGIARAAIDESLKHVKKRMAFGRPLSAYQSIQFKLADMYTMMRAGRGMVYEAAWRIDQGKPDRKLVAATKAFCGRMGVECADMALQMHGGYGYLSEYKVQRLYRDAKLIEIYEGTTEIEKLIVAKELLG